MLKVDFPHNCADNPPRLATPIMPGWLLGIVQEWVSNGLHVPLESKQNLMASCFQCGCVGKFDM